MSTTIASRLMAFYQNLAPPAGLPKGTMVLHPQKDKDVLKVMKQFFNKYFNDNKSRRIMMGINPGRFGAGVTGINFTAPRQLKDPCGIEHSWGDSSELSAEFIYEVIGRYGGPKKFYSENFISSVSPLGFTRNGINMNYYDDPALQQAVTPFIVDNVLKQLSFGFKTDRCICVGGEKNFKFLSALNNEYQFFREIIPLPHPRFILQYRRKQKDAYVQQYLDALKNN